MGPGIEPTVTFGHGCSMRTFVGEREYLLDGAADFAFPEFYFAVIVSGDEAPVWDKAYIFRGKAIRAECDWSAAAGGRPDADGVVVSCGGGQLPVGAEGNAPYLALVAVEDHWIGDSLG